MSKKDENIVEVPQIEKVRHSASHVLAQAVLKLFPDAKLGIGPAIENGFYYDFEFSEPITEEDLPKIEEEMKKIIKADLPITQQFKDRIDAIDYFKELEQEYKLDLIAEIPDKKLSFYFNGEAEFVDLCRGPHIESTGQIKAFKLDKIAGAYWRGDEKQKMLTRIYGLAFDTKEELDAYLASRDEAEKRDHRKLGPQLGIFFMDETAPGMPYWLPKGTVIVNELLDFWRKEHKKRGYQETITPQLNKKELYETSGHWEHYRDYMFISEPEEGQVYCLKPMNCPNAMTIYKKSVHSYRELPLRYSDCDALHRHEKAGELNGILRVQKFAQDDAHIFITENQIKEEYAKILDIAREFYSIFNISFKLRLGTRPDDFMGDPEVWDRAESELKEILENSDFEYFIGEGEGAFYGPKLDILMKDCMGREWQTGTIQLDFQLPRNFELKYTDSDGQEKTPVVIHRVIYGSLERFIGILIEHFAGAFPLWLSPVQAIILTISEKHDEYAKKVHEELMKVGIRAEIDVRAEKLSAKIRDAQLQKIPYIIVIGDKEVQSDGVSVRSRNGKEMGLMNYENFKQMLLKEIESKGKDTVTNTDNPDKREIKVKSLPKE